MRFAPATSTAPLRARIIRRSNLAAIAATIPVRRLGQPEDIARVAAFLCSDENTYVTGQEIVADGGLLCQ